MDEIDLYESKPIENKKKGKRTTKKELKKVVKHKSYVEIKHGKFIVSFE